MRVIFVISEPEILWFLTSTCSLIGESEKNVLAGAHRSFERCQHTEMYLLALSAQDESKMELSHVSVSKHAFWTFN